MSTPPGGVRIPSATNAHATLMRLCTPELFGGDRKPNSSTKMRLTRPHYIAHVVRCASYCFSSRVSTSHANVLQRERCACNEEEVGFRRQRKNLPERRADWQPVETHVAKTIQPNVKASQRVVVATKARRPLHRATADAVSKRHNVPTIEAVVDWWGGCCHHVALAGTVHEPATVATSRGCVAR